jgi:hypothetical protein
MWHTQAGDRILKGAEAQVFAASLVDLISDINLSPEFDDYELEIPIFDNLTYNQKITILLVIAKGLFKEDVPMLNLTALNEAAIAAVFEHLKFSLQVEIDNEDDIKYWRTLVRNALVELDYENIPDANEADPDEWDFAIDFLFELILWDTDYLMDNLMDDSPEVANTIKKEFGIYNEYFTDIVEDPDDKTVAKYLSEIKCICGKAL